MFQMNFRIAQAPLIYPIFLDTEPLHSLPSIDIDVMGLNTIRKRFMLDYSFFGPIVITQLSR